MAIVAGENLKSKSRLRRQLSLWNRNDRIFPALEIGLAAIWVVILSATYFIIADRAGAESLLPTSLMAGLLILNLLPAMGLMILVGRRIARARARKTIAGGTGQLHVRLVGLFSLIAAIPTILVVIFASLLFQYGIEFWFSDRARGMFENANDLARGYYEQNLRDVGNETTAMAGDLREYLTQAKIDSPEFAEGYSYQVVSRKMNESAIVEVGSDGVIRTAAIVDPGEGTKASRVTPALIKRLEQGEEIVVIASAGRIEAVTPIDSVSRIYLYSARYSDQLALSQWERAQGVLADYDQVSARSSNLQLQFNIALFFVSLILVSIALWAALKFADRMVRPLNDLAKAAREISTGNFSPRVQAFGRQDEVGILGRAFNRMTERLEEQTTALLLANDQLENRRAFIEAIFASVTAGILSVDEERRVRLINSSAQSMLMADDAGDVIGQRLDDLAPQLADLLRSGQSRSVVQFSCGKDLLTLAVKIVSGPSGSVITFEDITQQLLDQRQAAWSDVARRIAHEIKNPLTPIQLAAERLKRRYAKEVISDPQIFVQLTDTIVRQVGDLRKMVDEFSSFAQMPKPIFRDENLFDLARHALFLLEVAHPEISFKSETNVKEPRIPCDRRQIGQVITNILKNAVEAIEEKSKSTDESYRGAIVLSIDDAGDTVTLTLDDNGIGLPADRERIVEPYMTTREKGTGLGLAIVKKIVEEHFAGLFFDRSASGGTQVTLRFNRTLLQHMAIEEGKPTHLAIGEKTV